MKKLINSLLFFSGALLANIAFADDMAPIPGQSHPEIIAHDATEYIALASALHKEIFKTMEYLHLCKNYWEHQKVSPYSYFFGKNPTKWFWGKNQMEEIDEHINFIDQEIERNAYYIGKLHALCQQLRQESLPAKSAQLATQLKTTLFDECLAEIPDHEESDHIRISCYCTHSIAQLGSHQLPSHFARHWLQYTALLCAACVAGGYWYNNADAIKSWGNETLNSGKIFLEKNVKEPVRNIVNIFYNKEGAHADADGEALEVMVEDCLLRKYYPEGFASYIRKVPINRLTREEIKQRASEARRTGELPLELMIDYAHDSSHPFKNLARPDSDIGPIALTQVQEVKFLIRTLIKANQINLQLMTIIPALLAGYFSYKAARLTAGIYNPWHRKVAEIRLSLDKLEQHLNTYNCPDCLFDERGLGHTVFWTHHLKQLSAYISVEHVKRFNELLSIIEDYTQTIGQRMVLVSQLRRMI